MEKSNVKPVRIYLDDSNISNITSSEIVLYVRTFPFLTRNIVDRFVQNV